MPLSRLSDKPAQAFRITRMGQFADAAVEQAFQEHTLPMHRTGLRRTLLFGALAYLLLSVNDVVLLGGVSSRLFLWLLLVRVTCAAGCLGLSWYLGRQPSSAVRIGYVAVASSMLGLSGILVLQWLLPPLLLPLAVLLGMLAISTYLLVPHRQLHAVASVVASVLFLLIVAHARAATAPQLNVLATALFTVNLYGFLVGQEVQRSWRREFQTSIRLHVLSDHDHLTGCYNRRYLYDIVLPVEMERAQSTGGWIAVVACDIDHFKDVNDSHGHQAGDAALSRCAAILRDGTRNGIDTVVRFGGEEFLLLLPGTNLTGAVEVAERLRAALAAATFEGTAGQPLHITASFGVCAVDFDSEYATGQELIAAADRYMYGAKRAGRNAVHSGKPVKPGETITARQ
jgi:diguanylate cyclase (GGDEF)-like protein